MNYIYANQNIDLSIDVFKGSSTNKEDFSRADLKVFFLIGNDRLREAHECSVNTYGTIKVQAVAKTTGVYSVRVVWVKDGHKFMYCEQSNVFGVTNYADEATNPTTSEAKIKLTMHTATYGYDGLDAYELSVLRGKTSLSEEEWLEKINSGGGQATYVYTDWKLNFEIEDQYLNIAGTATTIPYSASMVRYKRWSDGRADEPEYGSVTVSTTASGVTIDSAKSKIYVEKNTSGEIKIIDIAANGNGMSPVIKSVKQAIAPGIHIVSLYSEEDGINLPFDDATKEIGINDSPVECKLSFDGSVSGIVLEAQADWINVGDFNAATKTFDFTCTTNPGTTTRNGAIKCTYNNGVVDYFQVQQSYVTGTSYENSAVLSYPAISSNGGSASPTLNITQVKVVQRSNDTIVRESMGTADAVKTYSCDVPSAMGQNGVVSTGAKNLTASEVNVAKVTASVTLNGQTFASNTFQVKQAAMVLKCYYGKYTKAISGWGSATDAKIANITGAKLALSIAAGDIKPADNDVKAGSHVEVNDLVKLEYVIGLVPVDAKFNGYAWKQYDEVNPIGSASSFIPFSENAGCFANGETTIEVNGINYRLYGQYCSGPMSFKLIDKV